MGIALNLQIAFGRIAIFTILILPIHEHGRSFHLLRSSPISFFRDLKFLSYRSFTCLVRVTPRHIICGYYEGCCLPNFFLSPFIRRAIDLFELIFYSAILLKVFISCKSSLAEFWGVCVYICMRVCVCVCVYYHSSANRNTLTSSFPICIPLISYCCLIALTRTPSAI